MGYKFVLFIIDWYIIYKCDQICENGVYLHIKFSILLLQRIIICKTFKLPYNANHKVVTTVVLKHHAKIASTCYSVPANSGLNNLPAT